MPRGHKKLQNRVGLAFRTGSRPRICTELHKEQLLAGSWLVISSVISRITMVIAYIRGLITPLITTHEPPSIWVVVNIRVPFGGSWL